ncbi:MULTISPECIES: hypothetical protein [unclassified Rhizobium]|uniref:hypothetical protein n=1 Tax=unclassified Rhizobium TaxID=2613769 RepID=UPI0007E96E0E|nr:MULTISPECIES: hypothetical protein [unclassified Rhizobium]ANK88024.1 hypothetical protein AMK02_PB00096 [Rhizobium sp. N731]ANL18270.1 hypothetical protein AMJ97_PB00096 [Rhizobium sp. N1314]
MASYSRVTEKEDNAASHHDATSNERGVSISRTGGLSALLLVLVLPNIWLFSGFFQVFQPPGWVDPGIYLGYFLGLGPRISTYGANYFSMRLPFTALGASLFYAFPPEVAQRVLIVFFNSMAAASVFVLVSRRGGLTAGVFGSLWLTLNPLWIASIARGYVDGPAMAYLLASLALLDYRQDWKRRRLTVAVGGAFSALAVFTHPITALLLLLFGLHDIWCSRRQMAALLKDTLWAAVGGIAGTAVLAIVSRMVGGRFFFFLADTTVFSRSLNGFGANYRYDLVDWVPAAYRLAPPLALLILGGILVIQCKEPNIRALALRGLSMAAGVGLFLLLWDYGVGGAMLQSSFYASYMIVGQALIVGALAAYASRHIKHHLVTVITTGTIAVAFALAIYGYTTTIWSLVGAELGHLLTWAALGVAFAIAGALVFSRLALAGLILLLASTMVAGLLNHDTRRIFNTHDSVDFVTTFRSTIKVANFVNRHVGPDERLLFWFQRDEMSRREAPRSAFTLYTLRYRDNYLLLNYWDSLVAVWLWDRALLGSNMPALTVDELNNLRAFEGQTSVVTLCLNEVACNNAAAALGDYGFDVTGNEKIAVDTGYLPMTAVLYKLSRHR